VSAAVVILAAALGAQAGEPRPLQTLYLRQGESVELSVVVGSAAERRLRWFEARPEARDYDNVRRCHGRPRPDCAAPIAYHYDELTRWRGRVRVQANAVDIGLGSHRYLVTLGAAPAPADSVAALPEIVVRRDDSYTGYLTELIGTPFVLWPTADEVDGRRGADCVALVIYGRRRLGHRVPYVSPRGLAKLTTRIAAGRFARDAAPGSRPSPIPVRVGDIVHFGFQTAVVVEDRAPRGVLTERDVIIHSFHGVAEQVPLGRVPYAHFPFEVRRWIAPR